MTQKKAIKTILNMLIAFVAINCFVYLFSVLSFCIPADSLRDNARESMEQLETEGTYPEYLLGGQQQNYFFDNFTDTVIVNAAITREYGSPFKNALTNAFSVDKDAKELYYGDINNLRSVVDGEQTTYFEYTRYYSLFTSVMRVIMLGLNLGQIRFLAWGLALALLIVTVVLIYRKLGMPVAISFTVMCIMTGLPLIVQCLAYATDIIMMYGLCIMVLMLDGNEKFEKREPLVFFIIGMVTYVLNYWSMPIYSFCMPMLLMIMMRAAKGVAFKENAIGFVRNGILWSLGLVVELLLRQLLNVLFLGESTVMTQLFTRITGESAAFTNRGMMLRYNFYGYFHSINKLLIVLTCIYLIVALICQHKRIKSTGKGLEAILLAAIMLVPILWLLVFAEHAGHGYDKYQLAVMVMGLFSVLAPLPVKGEA